MRRVALAVSLVLALPPVWAQSYQPEIAYTVESGGGTGIYVANRDGSGAAKVYQGPKRTAVGNLGFSPAGDAIAFTEGSKLRLVPIQVAASGVTAGAALTLVDAVGSGGDFSPDGSMLAYQTVNGGSIAVIDADGSGNAVVANGVGSMPRWLCSGDLVVYQRLAAGIYEVRRVSLTTPSVTALFTTSIVDGQWDTARTGESIVYRGTRPGSQNSAIVEYDITSASFSDLLSNATDFAFSPDDAEIVYSSNAKRASGMYRLSLTNGNTVRIGNWANSLDWRPAAGSGCAD